MGIIQEPAGFVPGQAMEFDDGSGGARRVSAASPLPVEARLPAASSTPLSGSTAASSVAGPFTPHLGRTLRLKLWGSWTGTVQVQSSIDGGVTKLPLTAGGAAYAQFSGNCNEAVDVPGDAAETFYIAITLASGTLNYRVSQ